MSNQIKEILKKISDPKSFEEAFKFAEEAYKDRQRANGENYIEHAKRVALTLSEMGLDSKTVIAGLLHDVVDEMPPSLKKIELKEIESRFGKEVSFLVEKVSGLRETRYPLTIRLREKKRLTKEKIENIKKMFLALAEDLRVVLIELASRLDNLSTLDYLPEQKQKFYSFETLKIFVPIADRLGLGEIKSKLADLAFHYLYPQRLEWLKNNIKEKYEERKRYLKSFIPWLKKILKSEGLKVLEIDSRAKSYWSTYQKLLRKNMDLEKIYDLVAVRIVAENIEDCYKAVGIIHKYCKPLTEEFDNFIAKPKPNGYRSIHTTVFCEKGQISEIQIRTPEMHKEAEYGICAHWAYKEGVNLQETENGPEVSEEVPEFWKNFKIDLSPKRVFVFTPKGDAINLPKGSTPVDFAFAVHSDIGTHCESAKVNGKIVSLSQPLKNGDLVEIIVNKKRIPSPDWLKFVRTSLAKAHIKKGLAKTESSFKTSLIGKIFSLPRLLKKRVVGKTKEEKKPKEEKEEVYLAGEKGISATFAKCCSPTKNDEVKAYIAKYKGAILHKTSCKDFQKLAKKFPDRIVDASWHEG